MQFANKAIITCVKPQKFLYMHKSNIRKIVVQSSSFM